VRLKETRSSPSDTMAKSQQWFVASLLAFFSFFGLVLIYRLVGRSLIK
jgi:hypothetical protein